MYPRDKLQPSTEKLAQFFEGNKIPFYTLWFDWDYPHKKPRYPLYIIVNRYSYSEYIDFNETELINWINNNLNPLFFERKRGVYPTSKVRGVVP